MFLGVIGVGSRWSKICPPIAIPCSHHLFGQREHPGNGKIPISLRLNQPFPAVMDSNHLMLNLPHPLKPVIKRCLDHPFDRRIKSRTVPSACEHTDSFLFHCFLLLSYFPLNSS